MVVGPRQGMNVLRSRPAARDSLTRRGGAVGPPSGGSRVVCLLHTPPDAEVPPYAPLVFETRSRKGKEEPKVRSMTRGLS